MGPFLSSRPPPARLCPGLAAGAAQPGDTGFFMALPISRPCVPARLGWHRVLGGLSLRSSEPTLAPTSLPARLQRCRPGGHRTLCLCVPGLGTRHFMAVWSSVHLPRPLSLGTHPEDLLPHLRAASGSLPPLVPFRQWEKQTGCGDRVPRAGQAQSGCSVTALPLHPPVGVGGLCRANVSCVCERVVCFCVGCERGVSCVCWV